MNSKRIAREVIGFGVCLGWFFGVLAWLDSVRQIGLPQYPLPEQFKPRYTDADLWAVARIATFEGQVFPEPLRSDAYKAIAWTMRNRVEIGFGGAIDYTDERLVSRYSSYRDHKHDPPDPRALEIARDVLDALTYDDDPTRGARHFVDNSYWTGTHAQTGPAVKVRGMFSDVDVRHLVEESRFVLTIEWKSPLDHPKGPLFYGLYFFDSWPPPTPIVTPTWTPTRRPTPTRTRTATATATITVTVSPTLTQSPAPASTGTPAVNGTTTP